MATGTEVAVTKLMWALGYNVPGEPHRLHAPRAARRRRRREVHAGRRQARARCGSTTSTTCSSAPSREPDGTLPRRREQGAPGKPIGRIRFIGTRPDDPERHRAARGSARAARIRRVRGVAEPRRREGDQLARHAGRRKRPRARAAQPASISGPRSAAAASAPADYWAGERIPRRAARASAKQLVGFGFSLPEVAYRRRSTNRRRSAGCRETTPTSIRTRGSRACRNQAFLHARADDKFWAAQKLVGADDRRCCARRFAPGEFGDPAAEEFLVRALAERRDAIARAYLTAINPIVDPDARQRRHADVPERGGRSRRCARAWRLSCASWSAFDNATGATESHRRNVGAITRLHAPAGLPQQDGAFIKVELSAIGCAVSPRGRRQ